MQSILIVLFFIGIFLAILNPLIGLYVFLIISYIRPQDFNMFLATLEPAKWILIVTFISFLFHTFFTTKDFVKAKQNLAIIGILFFILLSRMVAIDSLGWWNATEDFLRVILVYFLLINVLIYKGRLRKFFIFFVLINVFIAARYYLAYRTGTATYWGSKPGDVTTGFLANADDMGLGLVVALPFVLIPIFYSKNIIIKGLLGIASGIFMLGVLATDSRGALLGIFAVFIGVFATQFNFKKLRYNKYAIGMAIFLVLFTGFILKYRYTLRSQYESMQREDDSGRVGRMATWDAAKKMIRAKPLTGVGRGNFVAYWKANYPAGVFGYQVAHNVIYEVSAEIGLIGLFCFLLFSLYGLKEVAYFRKRYKEYLQKYEFIDMLFAIYSVSLLGFFVNGMFITVAFYWHIYILVALFVASKHIFLKEIAHEKIRQNKK